MKKKKLELKKETIANLNNQEMNSLHGGSNNYMCAVSAEQANPSECICMPASQECLTIQLTRCGGDTCLNPLTHGETCNLLVTKCAC